jgi:catechol 2,3-dioxygenase-like lactoylglutathione lyase family enzyme
MRFLHTMIRVNNLDESLRFYCDVLGMKLIEKETTHRQVHPRFRAIR